MNRTIFAVLLNALVFPGAGHIALRRPWRGAVFGAPALAALVYVLACLWNGASAVAEQLANGALPMEMGTIMSAASKQVESAPALAGPACWLIVVCWIGAIIDAMLAKPASTN